MNARPKISHTHASTFYLSVFMTAVLLAAFTLSGVAPVVAQGGEAVAEPDGYTYTVLEGDSWGSVASKTNVDVEVLQAANPDFVRDTGYLNTGDKLTIPVQEEAPSQIHVVKSGESWSSIADRYGVSVSLLQAANTKSMRPGYILYRSERLVIPPSHVAEIVVAVPEATQETVEEAIEEPVEEVETDGAAVAPTAEVTATVEVTESVETGEDAAEAPDLGETIAVTVTDSAESDAGSEAAVTTTPTSTMVISDTDVVADAPVCPEKFADYPEMMLEVINSEPGKIEALSDFLIECGALVEESFVVTDLNGDEVDDLVAVYQNPDEDSPFVEGDLVIFNSTEDGYEMPYRARAAGEVRLLSTEDINEDGLLDVVWIDTTCGASTCFDTVNVRSWDGSNWTDWTDGTITMAYAEISVGEILEEGQGLEIELGGGIYGSVGAGPQRSRVEIWSSAEGAPYSLVDKVYNDSECLYHTVLDANRAFLDAPEIGFEASGTLYEKAATDETLIKCWVRNDELDELRSFSLFRLGVSSGYQNDVDSARDRITELSVTYPESAYAEAGAAWLQSFLADGDAAAACADVTAYAEENPAAWETLADYGYTNPSFEAADVCPMLELPEADVDDSATDADSAISPQPATPVGGEAAGDVAFSDCPDDLSGYSDALKSMLDASAGDQAVLQDWMAMCGVMDDDMGAVLLADLNSDGIDDALLFPTMETDLGFGPHGAQGAVLIYHGQPNGSYKLVANPEIYGMPVPFAVGDFDDDGRTDVAWTVTGCATFCVTEVQMWTWDGDAYVSLIQPGATIVEGVASIEPVAAGDPGNGQQLVLVGGISGTPEGGLEVSHLERWQSIDGSLYQRVGWEYDRTADGGNCLGLRLVEADVALQASAVLGYDPAIDLYAQALDPTLQACSIFGMPADEELVLLQGLAAFRLTQAQALSGDIESARSTVDALSAGQPDGLHPDMAAMWLAEFSGGADPVAACEAVAPVLEENVDLWQITDHYGYNHPAMAVEQICYVP